ncbi:uncharacterized protein LOC143579712 [Bidens hawaiensis]|uniref:uncharacterized protein LOC143579712 n=1 Tax=Bidens hawaiensis TaxID=980011 RepID=UPI00404917D4
MIFESPKDAMPWVGLYTAIASLICTFAMAADAIQAFRQWKLWFPNKFFTLNAATITLIAIAMKLPLDLTSETYPPPERYAYYIDLLSDTKTSGMYFLVTMLANLLPSLGLMDDRELLMNIIALGILVITIDVNVFIQFEVALTVSTTRKKLEYRYKESQQLIICKIICLVPRAFLILLSCGCYFFKSFWKRFKKVANASNSNLSSELEEYTMYVVQIEEEAKFSNRTLRNTLLSITQLLDASEKKEPRNLIELLDRSKCFNGVVKFDNNQVPPLHPEEPQNCWSLVLVTLTSIAIALPNIENGHFKELLAGMKEGLRIVRHIEECLNVDGDSIKARKSARRLWTEVVVYRTWLQTELQKKARKGKTSKEILTWLGDEAAKIVIQSKSNKKASIDHSPFKFVVACSMYRISQTILLQCNEQENLSNDMELFEWISTTIADILSACFTNLPRVIQLSCHHHAIKKRGDSIQNAARLLGKSKKILKMLKARQLPNIDLDSMAYIDKWCVLTLSQIPNGSSSGASTSGIRQGSSAFNGSLTISIM